ncbi:ABC transporter substrate-binding protein [Halobacillus salinarum]|uniref:ABC transporter substrate-binding protein n=1 Tax=Halobacillus salinarum TaxID=2932257 RepID=A0ABY4EIK2_9BACI|nr:ABC transporter substrate-binding protein [Halobacillus salinarum]UOQ44305.1 ABC transporter substrate-binding protein [Halobacillus salinarum]
MWKRFALLSLFILLFLSACNSKEEKVSTDNKDKDSGNTITAVDSAGKEFTVDAPIEKAVVLNRNIAEALTILGADNHVVATGDTTLENNPYLHYDDLPDLGETSEVNIEKIISMDPDVVFTYTNRPDNTLEAQLEPAGISVIRLDYYLPGKMNDELRLLGKLFNKEDRAAKFIEWKTGLETLLKDRVSEIPDKEKKSVMALSVGFLNSQGGYRIFPSQTTAGNPGVGEGYATILAGGKDAADVKWNSQESSTTVLVDEEYVLKKDPDVLTLHGTWLGGYETSNNQEFEDVYNNIIDNTSVSQLTASKTKNIFIYHTDIIGSNKRFIGALQLAKDLYPKKFQDIKPFDYLEEYFEKWLGVEYKGTWHYSPKED